MINLLIVTASGIIYKSLWQHKSNDGARHVTWHAMIHVIIINIKSYVNIIQKRCRLPWAWKWESETWTCQVTAQIAYRNHGCRNLLTKEEKDHPDRYLQKPASVMVWEVFVPMASWVSDIICEGSIKTERHTQVLERHMLPFRWLYQKRPCLIQRDILFMCSNSVSS